jgi:hypothetical protein
MTSSQIYWITRLDNINTFVFLIFAFGVVAALLCGICWINFPSRASETIKKYLFRILLISIIDGFISIWIPTTKEMAAIIIIPKLINAISSNQQLIDLPNNFVALANDWIKELSPKKKE